MTRPTLRLALASTIALSLATAAPASAGGWRLTESDIAHIGVAEIVSEDGAATLIVYCGKKGGERPTFALNASALTSYGEPREAWVRLIGPVGSAHPDPDGKPQSEELVIDGQVHSRSGGAIFLADIAAAGLYEPRLNSWDSFHIAVGRTSYEFQAAGAENVSKALGGCLYW